MNRSHQPKLILQLIICIIVGAYVINVCCVHNILLLERFLRGNYVWWVSCRGEASSKLPGGIPLHYLYRYFLLYGYLKELNIRYLIYRLYNSPTLFANWSYLGHITRKILKWRCVSYILDDSIPAYSSLCNFQRIMEG